MRAPAVALAAVLAACPAAPAPRPPTPAPVVAGEIDVAPFAFTRDDGPDRVLLLGTAPGRRATVLPLAAGSPRATVPVVFAHPQDGGTLAGVSTVTVTAGPGDGAVDAARITDPAGGRGPRWRAGVRRAAHVAADVLGKDPTALAFAVTAADAVDGPAASALLSAAFVAALLGRPITAGVTLAGTLEADGTIGPVDELAAQLATAARHGITRFGVPRGSRAALEPAPAGVELVELADVHDALALLTGPGVPRPIAVDEAAMAVPAPAAAALAVQYARWQQRLAPEWPRVLTLTSSRAVPAMIARAAQAAHDDLAAAERARADGRPAAALHLLTRAWIQAVTATTSAAIVAQVRAGQLDLAAAPLDALEALAATDDTPAGPAIAPASLTAHLQRLSRFERAGDAAAARTAAATVELPRARTLLASLAAASPAERARADTADQVALAVGPAVASLARAIVATDAAAATAAIELAPGAPGFRPLLPVAQRLARWLGASTANGGAAPPALPAAPPDAALEAALRALAAARFAPPFDAAPALDGAALASLLDAAAQRAREHAQIALLATGAIPVQAQLHHERAQALRAGDPTAQREALAAYRTASAFSQLATTFARF